MRDAARAIAQADRLTLRILVDKSLLQYNRDAGRYQLHELLRQYAWEQLQATGEAEETTRAHALDYAGLMQSRWPHFQDHRQGAALLDIRADWENVRTAWSHWVQRADGHQIRRFLLSFWVVHDMFGWYASGSEPYAEAIQVLKERTDLEARFVRGWLHTSLGLYRTPKGVSSREGLVQAVDGVALLGDVASCPELILT